MKIGVRFLLFATILAVASFAPAQDILSPSREQHKLSFPQKIFFEGGGTNGYCFPGQLFEIDNSIKKHPPSLCGSSLFVSVGYRLTRSWSLSARISSQDSAGSGDWKRATGNALEDSYDAQASGRTGMKTFGVTLVAQKEFSIGRWINPYLEFGGGIKTMADMDVVFHGTATAIDPQSGESFQVPATDHVRNHFPVVILGGGIHVHLYRGVQLGPGWEWNTGYNRPLQPLITLRLAPFQLFSKESH